MKKKGKMEKMKEKDIGNERKLSLLEKEINQKHLYIISKSS